MKNPTKPIVYIASAYASGDPAINTHFQCRIFDQLLTDGIVIPYVPLWTHFQHTVFPRPCADWPAYDNAMIDSGAFTACLRLTVEGIGAIDYRQENSSGADAEVERFRQQGKPVFFDKASLYEWAKNLA